MIGRPLAVALALLLAACGNEAPPAASAPAAPRPGASANPERYARDRDLCRTQVDETMRTRRAIDDSRQDVFRGDYERHGQTTLPEDMANYGDSRRADRLIARCMEARGWAPQQQQWWQKIGS